MCIRDRCGHILCDLSIRNNIFAGILLPVPGGKGFAFANPIKIKNDSKRLKALSFISLNDIIYNLNLNLKVHLRPKMAY